VIEDVRAPLMQAESDQAEGEQGRENPQQHIEPCFEGYI
jgi:hypothetical protein